MDQNNVYVFGLLLALQAEVEAMKAQNQCDLINHQQPTYGYDAFDNKANEIRDTTAKLFH